MKLRIIGLFATSLIINACATTGENPADPYEDFNRSMWEFNKSADKALLKPIAKGYKAITPDPVEKGVSNFFSNIGEVPTIINDVLQFKLGKALKDTGRFLINSTLGLAGLLDPATDMGLEHQPEDFGQTLATWGVGDGAYIMLPFFGPSTTRDAFGQGVDSFVIYNLYDEMNDDQTEIGLRVLDVVQTRAGLLSLEDQLNSAPDDYTLIRDVYLQRREFLIHDGKPSIEDDECEFEEDCEDF
ncbi:MAG: VacJ family lipoprotein [Gammaproteobacteria bacterium]|nr:VacJ family lipoprotein [Gammaproteobacteria bacterium]